MLSLLLIFIILFAIQAVYDIDKNFFMKRIICFVTLYINNVLNSMYV